MGQDETALRLVESMIDDTINLADVCKATVPSRELSLAYTKLEEARMWMQAIPKAEE